MQGRIKRAILKTPLVRILQFALMLAAAGMYAGAYAAAAHASQILAAVACVIGVLIITNTIPDGDDI